MRAVLVITLWVLSFPLAILYHLLRLGHRGAQPSRPGLFDRRNWGG